MPDTVDEHHRSAPAGLDPAVAPPAYRTPWDRVRGWARAMRGPGAGETPTARIARGERHVRAGTSIAAAGIVANAALAFATLDRPLTVVGALVTWTGVLLALRSGSRVARWMGMVLAVAAPLAAANLLWIAARDWTRSPFLGMTGPLAIGLLVVTAGLALATLTQPAHEWFAHKRAERQARRERIARARAQWREENDPQP